MPSLPSSGKSIFSALDEALWRDGFQQAAGSFLDGAKVKRAGWDLLLKLQGASTGKDYRAAAYEKALLPIAPADQVIERARRIASIRRLSCTLILKEWDP